MQILVKLYCSDLESQASSMPICIKNKHQYEMTLRDLKKQIHADLQYPDNFKPQF